MFACNRAHDFLHRHVERGWDIVGKRFFDLLENFLERSGSGSGKYGLHKTWNSISSPCNNLFFTPIYSETIAGPWDMNCLKSIFLQIEERVVLIIIVLL